MTFFWSADEDEQLVSMRNKGMTRDKIAEALGRSKKAVSERITRLGLPYLPKGSPYDAKIIELRAASKNYAQIAAEIGITRQAVAGRIRRLRLPLPKKRIKRRPKPLEFRPDPELLQLTEGHVAADQRSYEILMEILNDKIGNRNHGSVFPCHGDDSGGAEPAGIEGF